LFNINFLYIFKLFWYDNIKNNFKKLKKLLYIMRHAIMNEMENFSPGQEKWGGNRMELVFHKEWLDGACSSRWGCDTSSTKGMRASFQCKNINIWVEIKKKKKTKREWGFLILLFFPSWLKNLELVVGVLR
jgi:hypothetical protein